MCARLCVSIIFTICKWDRRSRAFVIRDKYDWRYAIVASLTRLPIRNIARSPFNRPGGGGGGEICEGETLPAISVGESLPAEKRRKLRGSVVLG